jgi:hypothetical protein
MSPVRRPLRRPGWLPDGQRIEEGYRATTECEEGVMKRSSARQARRWVILELTRSLDQLSDITVRAEDEACGGSAKELCLQRLAAV